MTKKRLLGAGGALVALTMGRLPGHGHAAADRAALLKQHSGGTLKLTASGGTGSLDVQINYEVKGWELAAMVYDGLVAFKKVGGHDSNTVVPDLAEAIPEPQDGGKTYVFKLRSGIKFADGSDVTTKDVVGSFQRLFKVSNPNAGSWYNIIVGSDACLKTPASCTLDGGVVADEAARTVTFHLTAPDSEFLYKMSTPFASIIPASTPPKDLGTSPMPGTGAYTIKSYDPNKAAILVRNPHFKEWSADAQPQGYPDEIDWSIGLQDEAEVTAILNGQYDYMFDEKPLDRLAELSGKHKNLLHIGNLLAYYYMPLNTRLPPFDNVKARQAVAYAVDRHAIVNLFGGQNLGAPLCQQLPVGMGGYTAYCPYTQNPGTKWTKPDLAKAKQLVKESGTAGQEVTLITSDKVVEKSIGVYLQSVLNAIGYKASVKAISSNIQFTYIQNTNNKVQASLTDWYQDYPAPSDFIYVLFGCSSFNPGSDSSINIAGYCNKPLDDEMKQALVTAVTDKPAAYKMWSAIDKKVTDDAPAVALFQPKNLDLVSARLGNYTFSEQSHMVFDQAWVK